MVVSNLITSKKQIVKKTVNGQIYMYERTSYYDKSLKNTKYHYRYVRMEIIELVEKGTEVILDG